MKGNIFEEILGQDSLFTDRKAFDHAFEPARLPHREHELDSLVRNLVDALNGHIPSNMLLYGGTWFRKNRGNQIRPESTKGERL